MARKPTTKNPIDLAASSSDRSDEALSPAPVAEEQATHPLSPPESPAPSASPEPAASPSLWRVWAHGTLQRDGKTYQPGETLTLPEAVARGIPCLAPAGDED